MKSLLHLAIFTSLALNSVAGWHDSAPYQAWPATNNLRWTTNVGTYTNQPDWRYNGQNITNSDGSVTNYGTGYGAWTNNYLSTNIWTYQNDNYSSLFFDPWPYPEWLSWPVDISALVGAEVAPSNMLLNAKEVRALDCTFALVEREGAISGATNITSAFWGSVYDGMGYDVSKQQYRDEARTIAYLKNYIVKRCLGSFYYTTNNWLSVIAFNESNLCATASVPTNFLRYTPARAADGSWTHYGRVYTNTYLLVTTGVYELVTSAGTEIPYTNSTPSNSVTLYSTNTSIQSGRSLTEYGWDGMRRIITNLVATVKTPTWGIGSGTNWSSVYGTNFASSIAPLVSFTAGVYGAVVDWGIVKPSASTANPKLPYSIATIPIDNWSFDFSNTLTNPVVFQKTNIAPYASAKAMVGHEQEFYSDHEAEIWGYTPYDWVLEENPPTWRPTADQRDWYRTNNTDWVNYGAPLVYSSSSTNIGRTLLLYAKTNGTSFLVDSNYYGAGVASSTSAIVRIAQPVLENFGFSLWGYTSYGDDEWWYGYPFWDYGQGQVSLQSVFTTGYSLLSGGPVVDQVSLSTNIPSPTVTADKAVEIWDFKYK